MGPPDCPSMSWGNDDVVGMGALLVTVDSTMGDGWTEIQTEEKDTGGRRDPKGAAPMV